jgi:hypothetical protein
MKTLLTLSLFSAINAMAAITTNVVHIEMPVTNKENIEVFVTHEGRVFELALNEGSMLETLDFAREHNIEVELEVESGVEFNDPKKIEKILDVKLLSHMSEAIREEDHTYLTPMSGYRASNVASLDEASAIFKTLITDTKMFSQCFNRAHIWAKQMYDNFNVHSMKILIYYTKKYRAEVSKKWWFHIAPMIDVNGEYMVMDREFTRNPVSDEKWEKIFTNKMGNIDYRCKKIDNIKEYYDANNMNNEFCNIQHTSMYYWEPNDMSRLDKTGTQKTSWVNWELRAAAKEAFKNWKKVYDTYKVQ